MIEFLQAHAADLVMILAILVRAEMAIAKLTKTTTDDAIGQKISDALKNLGIDSTKPL